MLSVEEGIKYLQASGAKITSQRIAIMKSLAGRSDHPSAEKLFLELKPQYPTLSIATVYSTTQILAQASMLRILSIDERKVYFDPDTHPHAHFMCTQCKKIIDIDVDLEILTRVGPKSGVASIENTEIFHYGLCSECGSD
ncbi:MAG: transcriptional repressor [Synergistaceae bacterium]|jgi:Fur family peroxide stress response transcriptional regulator|nr:transcriptional repressor [Synergistaceae bacterium]